MKLNLNKLNSDTIDNFLIDSNTGNIKRTSTTLSDGTTWGGTSCDLFAHCDDRKKVIAYLKINGLDAFKRGTKEPAAIATALKTASWSVIKDLDPAMSGARSMWD